MNDIQIDSFNFALHIILLSVKLWVCYVVYGLIIGVAIFFITSIYNDTHLERSKVNLKGGRSVTSMRANRGKTKRDDFINDDNNNRLFEDQEEW